MNIIVCVKQVPEEIRIDKISMTLRREGIRGVINPCDKHALELATRLKGQNGKVTVITMGPPQAESSLIEALAMGADEGIFLCDRAFAGADTLATSYVLAAAIKKVGEFDLILCGRETADSGTRSVGPQVAAHLGIPQVTSVVAVEIVAGRLRIRRTTEDELETLEAGPPVLVTINRGINQPRLPAYGDILAASSKPIFRWGAADLQVEKERLGLAGSPTKIIDVFVPEAKRRCEMISGPAEKVAEELTSKLRNRGAIK